MDTNVKKTTEVIDHYHKTLREEIEWLMKLNGHNFEETEFILESALDFALNDIRNKIYK